ncbi:hypothetical protein [Jannaschia sp. R86511]|uniref:hypothetical protein n=1 Tax=Jannaschia sp. R86511 TaxID=3093853 RepID=UPI0036D3439C
MTPSGRLPGVVEGDEDDRGPAADDVCPARVTLLLLGHRSVLTWRLPQDLPHRRSARADLHADVARSLRSAEALRAEIEQTFGAGRGELSQVARRRLDMAGCHGMAMDVLEFCCDAYQQTDGLFDAFDTIDLSADGAGRRHLDPGLLGLAWAVDRVVAKVHDDTGLGLVLRAGPVVGVRAPAGSTPFTIELPGTGRRRRTATPEDLVPVQVDLLDGGAVVRPGLGNDQGTSVTVAGPDLRWSAVYAGVLAEQGRAGLRVLRPVPGLHATVRTASGALLTLDRGEVTTQDAPPVLTL